MPKGSVPPIPRVWKDPRAFTANMIAGMVGGDDVLDRYAYEPNTLTRAQRRQVTRFIDRHGQRAATAHHQMLTAILEMLED